MLAKLIDRNETLEDVFILKGKILALAKENNCGLQEAAHSYFGGMRRGLAERFDKALEARGCYMDKEDKMEALEGAIQFLDPDSAYQRILSKHGLLLW